MDDVFRKMEAPALRDYIEFLLWHYRVVDAFWFLYVAEDCDQPTAERVNERVWERVAGMAVKDLLPQFGISDRGLRGLVRVLELYPWRILTDYVIEETDDEVTVSVPACPTQLARLKHGLGEFVCREMHRRQFTSLARAVDERLQVECLFAPPDPHPADLFCKWRFFMAPEPDGSSALRRQ
jgi:hypothetical protein